jgi:uncharacterized protein YfaT (DUF1175 family)
MPRLRAGLLSAIITAVAFAAAGAFALGITAWKNSVSPIRVEVRPESVLANGYDTAELSVESGSARPVVSVVDGQFDNYSALVKTTELRDGKWHVLIRAGIRPGRVRMRVEAAGRPAAWAELVLKPDDSDTLRDGTPDFLRLDDERDRTAFRNWFTWLAEAQYFQAPAARSYEITDCAALVRYAYREALHVHDSAWANSEQLPFLPPFDSVAKYQYPVTPLYSSLFRTRPGPFRHDDLADGTFLQFADAKTLWLYNSHIVSRDIGRALPGDLLLYRQESDHPIFHAMIYLGESQLRPDGRRYVLYHTGPTGKDPGEMRRLTVEELLRFPQPEWRPLDDNESFLGVARWNILRALPLEATR